MCAPPHTHTHSFDYGDAHFVVLDSSSPSEFEAMLEWLRGDLAWVTSGGPGGSYAWLVAVVHHPPYSKVLPPPPPSDA